MKKIVRKKSDQSLAGPPLLPAPAPLSLPRFAGKWKFLAFAFALLLPGPAFALGLLYALQADSEAKRFGRICLVLALVGFVLHMGSSFSSKDLDGGESYLQPYN